jgi:hypothetical protein
MTDQEYDAAELGSELQYIAALEALTAKLGRRGTETVIGPKEINGSEV